MDGPRILLADDDADLSGILAKRLEGEGFTVSRVMDGEAALAALTSAPPDLAVLDVHMPGLTGVEACARAREAGASCPILLLTSSSEKSVVEGALRAGATGYLLKPPRFEELLSEIRRHLQGAPLPEHLPEATLSPRLSALLDQVSVLPAMPLTTQKLLEVLNNPSAGAKELGKVISLDPAITAQVLRLANSAYYGQPGKISDITKAVILIGFAEISHALMALSLASLFARREAKEVLDRKAFWEHALACSVIAAHLAKRQGEMDPNQAMIAGLLHDLGKLVLAHAMPDDYAAILKRAASERRSGRDVEREVLGDNHTLLGEVLAKRWQLPEPISRCIRYHHVPLSIENLPHEIVVLVRLVCAADALAKGAGLGASGDDFLEEVPDRVWNLLSVDQKLAAEAVRAGRRAVALHKTALGAGGGAAPEAPPVRGAVLHLLESDQPVSLLPFALEALGREPRTVQSWGDASAMLEGEDPPRVVVLESSTGPKDSRLLEAFTRWRKGRDRPGIVFIAPGRRAEGAPPVPRLLVCPRPLGIGALRAALESAGA